MRMKYKLALASLAATSLLFGQDNSSQKVRISKTENMEFPAGGTLRLQNSTGEVTIEGWDGSNVEIATTRSTKDEYAPQERDRAMRELDRVQIATKLNGNELVVTTEFPHHRAFPYAWPLSRVANVDLTYSIKVPRTAKIIVKHDAGDVHVDDVAGNVQVEAVQGLIALRLAGDSPRSIDAKSKAGSVTSDFAGSGSRHPFPIGHQFVQSNSGASQNLHLRIGFGDIIILKASNPQPAIAATPK